MSKKNNFEISQIVGRNFLRVCKEHQNMYKHFLNNFQKIKDSPLGKCKTFTDLCNSNAKTLSENRKEPFGNDIYQPIVRLINNLLSIYLEKNCRNHTIIPMMGQRIFDLSCNEIFGDQFIQDMENEQKNLNIPQPQNDFDVFCISQFSQYVASHGQNGQNNPIKFNEFMERFGNQLTEIYYGKINNISHRNNDEYQPYYENDEDENEYGDEEEYIDYADENDEVDENEDNQMPLDDAFNRLFNNN